MVLCSWVTPKLHVAHITHPLTGGAGAHIAPSQVTSWSLLPGYAPFLLPARDSPIQVPLPHPLPSSPRHQPLYSASTPPSSDPAEPRLEGCYHHLLGSLYDPQNQLYRLHHDSTSQRRTFAKPCLYPEFDENGRSQKLTERSVQSPPSAAPSSDWLGGTTAKASLPAEKDAGDSIGRRLAGR